ncbi:uncharacterized protein [Heliangelus exortis]|uniref:uncharacterized protein isoform X1 n=1 Tax=Heliangelus exortis TaxID=472823 RepID=UPI003A935167
MALINQKQIGKRNKTKNTSTEILRDLRTEDHSLRPSTLDVISKKSTQRKRVNFVKNENTQCKCIKISDEMKSTFTMSKKQANLLAKIKLLIGERMEILNNDLNQKLDILNQRFAQVQQCTKQCEEIAKTLLKKASKLESYINAAIAFQQQLSSRMAFCQPMFPRVDYQNTVLSQLGPSAFYPNAIMPRICNIFLLPPYTGFPSVHVPQYVGSDDVTLNSMETPNTAAANNPEQKERKKMPSNSLNRRNPQF